MIPEEIEEKRKAGYLPIFKTGKHRDMSGVEWDIDTQFLDRAVNLYDRESPEFKEAPVCIGHPKHDRPAYGWIDKLERVGNYLLAKPKQLMPQFVQAVKDGYFKYVSSKFRPDGSLKHLAALGSQPPAVAGLGDISSVFQAAYSDGEEGNTFILEFGEFNPAVVESRFNAVKDIVRGIKNYFIEKETAEKAESIIPEYAIEWLAAPFAVNEANTDHSYCEINLNTMEETLKKEEEKKIEPPGKAAEETTAGPAFSEGFLNHPDFKKILAFAESASKRADDAEKGLEEILKAAKKERCLQFAEGYVKDGIIAPNEKAGLLTFMSRLDTENELSFAEGETPQSPLTWFHGFMSRRNPVVPLDPLKVTGSGHENGDLLGFSESEIDAADLELDRSALKIQKDTGCMYEDALFQAMRR